MGVIADIAWVAVLIVAFALIASFLGIGLPAIVHALTRLMGGG